MYCNYYSVGYIFKILFDYIVLMIVYVKRHFNNITYPKWYNKVSKTCWQQTGIKLPGFKNLEEKIT